jgi:hypothetical protein
MAQIKAVVDSGLNDAADVFLVGINGDGFDTAFAQGHLPKGRSLIQHGEKSESLLPTMRFLQSWLPGHEDYAVLFFHSKGVTHPGDPLNTAWRNCMTRHVITDWRRCVGDLERGFDAVGCHWIHGKRDDPRLRQPKFFGGVFWMAKARFLLKLPPVPEKITKREDWFEPEWWIGSGPAPKIHDYHPQFPNLPGCTASAKSP